jgi:hypothetical protein
MKSKLFLITIAWFLLLIKVNAQSFTLQSFTGTTINNGDTLVISGTTNDFTLMSPLAVTNNSGTLKAVTVERTILSMVPGADNAFAWGIMNYPPFVNISVDPAMISAGVTDSSFQTWYFTNNTAGISYIKYRFYDDANPADSAWIVFQFNVLQVASIADQQNNISQQVYPNPSSGVFNIDPPATFNSTILAEVHNVEGALILKKSFSALAGSLAVDISDQPSGNYFLKLLSNESKLIKTIELIKN